MLRLVEPLHVEGHHHELDIEPLLMGRDLGFGAEHAERARIEPHPRAGAVLALACHSRLRRIVSRERIGNGRGGQAEGSHAADSRRRRASAWL
jgi:hypothetical protein